MISITTKGMFAEPYKLLNICSPDMTAHEEGAIYVDADYYEPSTRADLEDETPGMRSDVEELEPYIGGEDLRPSLRAFPES